MTLRGLVVIAALLVASCDDPRALGGVCTTDCSPMIHPDDIVDPTSPNFHGTLLKQQNWNFALCASCHGSDFNGGASGVSCLTCHAAGPTACVTCHGNGPTSNAHAAHAATDIACAQCHVVPKNWDDDGHIVHNGVAITTPAKVSFGALANVTPLGGSRTGPATWNETTCSNIYCHGGELANSGGTNPTPRWADATPPGGCTQCHGNPPPSHARNQCGECHPSGTAHINGIVEVGRTPGTNGCNGCHGSAASNAPPVDLEGNTFTTAIGVGAHQGHLQALLRLSAPIPCTACHAVPTAINSPGHIDSTGPAVVNAALAWDRESQTCSNATCHGVARPVWTSGVGAACGTCHGIPPADSSHNPAMTLTSCATCHPGTVDAFGNIIITNDTSEHINGVVDL